MPDALHLTMPGATPAQADAGNQVWKPATIDGARWLVAIPPPPEHCERCGKPLGSPRYPVPKTCTGIGGWDWRWICDGCHLHLIWQGCISKWLKGCGLAQPRGRKAK